MLSLASAWKGRAIREEDHEEDGQENGEKKEETAEREHMTGGGICDMVEKVERRLLKCPKCRRKRYHRVRVSYDRLDFKCLTCGLFSVSE